MLLRVIHHINGDVNDRSHLWLSMTIGMTRGYVEHAFSLHRHHLMMTMMMTLMTLFRILYVSSQTPAVPTKALDRLSSEKARSEDKSWTREAADISICAGKYQLVSGKDLL